MNLPTEYLDLLKANYPRRKGGQGWADTARLVAQHITKGHSWESILAGSRAYKDFCDREGLTGTEYVKQAATFFGKGQWWAEDYSEPAKPKLPQEIAKERRWQQLHDRADAVGFRYPTAIEKQVDPGIYEGHLREAERQSNVRAIK
jgi:hypothetical protein